MKRQEIIERLKWVPAWVFSLFAALMSAFVMGILKNFINEPLHPVRVWIVPLLCNILVILPAACDNSFWTTSFGIIIGIGVVLSFVMAHFGAMEGRQRDK
jgi:hypothetical protein